MPKFNHAVTVAFTVISDQKDGEDITSDMFRTALLKRIIDLDEHDQWREAIGAPFDTYQES